MKLKTSYLALMIASSLASSTMAQQVYVYPAKGQSPEQTEKDKRDCAAWAQQQSGFNPSQPAMAASAPPPKQGGVLRGAGRGAAVGAVGGAIAGDAGKGAAIGAASGALFGGIRRREATKTQEAQQQAAMEQMRNSYNRAYQACLEGKGYTVK